MADEELGWDIRFDLAGQGLGQAAAGLGKLGTAIRAVQVALNALEKGFSAIGGAASKLATLDNAAKGLKASFAGLGAAVGAVAGAIHLLDKFGDKAVEAFGERQSSLRAYTALLGNAAEAQKEFQKAQQLSQLTPFLSSQIEASQKQLFVAGLRNEGGKKSGGSADRALLAVSDLASLAADKNQALATGTRAFSEVIGKGHLSERQAVQLNQDLGLSLPIFRQEIAKQLHIKEGDVEKTISKKGVSSEVAQAAFEQAVLRQLNEKKLGETAASGANSLGVALVNQQEQVKNLLKTFDSELLPGVQRYKKALQDQGSAFSLASGTGQKMVLVLQDFANTSTHLKAGWTEFTNSLLTSFSESYTRAMKEVGISSDNSVDAGKNLRQLGEDIGQLGGIAFRVIHQLEPLIAKIAKTADFYLKPFEEKDAFAAQDKADKEKQAADEKNAVEQGKRAREIYDYLQSHQALLAKYPTIASEALSQKAGSAAESVGLALDRLNPAKAVKEAVKKHASASGGGGSPIGTFIPDYSLIGGGSSGGFGGVTLPQITTGPSISTSYQGLSAGIEAQRSSGSIIVENVDIHVDGTRDPRETANQVAEVLRGLGRFARTPSPRRL